MKRGLKKMISIGLCMLLLLSQVQVPVFALPEDAEASAGSETPIEILAASELLRIGLDESGAYPADGNYYLTQDLPVGYDALMALDFEAFTGTLSGSESLAYTTVYDAGSSSGEMPFSPPTVSSARVRGRSRVKSEAST